MIQSFIHQFADQSPVTQLSAVIGAVAVFGGGGMYAWIMGVDRRERRERAEQAVQRH